MTLTRITDDQKRKPTPTEIFLDKPIQHHDINFVNEFEVEVPPDFTLDGCPREGFSRNGWSSNINDANFPRSSVVRGRNYIAEAYLLQCQKDSESLVAIADVQKRVLPGALGGAFLTSRYGVHLPKNRWVSCLDKPGNLWRSARGLEVPGFDWDGVGWRFFLYVWQRDWSEGYCVVFFRELVAKS